MIICFDLGNFASFLNVKFWLNEVLTNDPDQCHKPSMLTTKSLSSSSPININNIIDADSRAKVTNFKESTLDSGRPFIFLIGTKRDTIASNVKVQRLHSEAKELAEQIGAEFWMCSSANGDNVSELFHRVACLTFNRYMANIAELALQELEQQKSQSIFYTVNGGGKVLLTSNDAEASSKKKCKKMSNKTCSRKTLARMVHVPQELLAQFITQLSDRLHSVLHLMNINNKDKHKSKSKKHKTNNKIHDASINKTNGIIRSPSTDNNNVDDEEIDEEKDDHHGKINSKKIKKKTFRCFNVRCTFVVEK